MTLLTDETNTVINDGDTAPADKAIPTARPTEAHREIHIEKKPVFDFFKRAFDIAASFLSLIVGFPVFFIIALVIVIDDFGNPFFVQERIGKNLKPFKMIKFRTMYKNAEELKPGLAKQNRNENVLHFKLDNDPRVTRTGRFLRKTSLDELPQLVNVLAGNMSLIGPRPFVRSEQELLPSDRLRVKPGLSCYWQVADKSKMTDKEQLELDYKYIRERSFSTDLKLIFMTIPVIFKWKNR